MNAIYRQTEASPNDPIGGKASALAALQHEGFRIPPWFAIAAEAFAGTSENKVPRLPDAIRALLPDAVREICPGNELVAVRSSAIDEDGVEHSFAGQLQSFLSVEHAEISEKAFAVARSAGGRSVRRYRQERGLNFDSHLVDDACLIVRDGKYWFYYKGRQLGKSPGQTQMGVAIADKPEGPYLKHKANPVIPGNHEVLVWTQGNGVAAMIGSKLTIVKCR